MSFGKNTPRLLGIAFLFQAIASLLSETISDSLIEVDSISNSMVNISNSPITFQLALLVNSLQLLGSYC